MRTLTYLACPYTHPDPAVKEWRFRMANKAAALLTHRGLFVFSPISSSHPIALDGGLPTTWEFWRAFDRAFLEHCKEIYVLTIPGWLNSAGVQAELQISVEMGIPHLAVSPDEFMHDPMPSSSLYIV